MQNTNTTVNDQNSKHNTPFRDSSTSSSVQSKIPIRLKLEVYDNEIIYKKGKETSST